MRVHREIKHCIEQEHLQQSESQMPGNAAGKARAKAKASPTFIRKSHIVKYPKGARRSPPVVQRKTEKQLETMSPKSLEVFAKTCKEAAEMAAGLAASKRELGLPSFGFGGTQEEPRRATRCATDNLVMDEEAIADDDRSSSVRKADRRTSPRLMKTPELEASGNPKVVVSPAPAPGAAGPSNW